MFVHSVIEVLFIEIISKLILKKKFKVDIDNLNLRKKEKMWVSESWGFETFNISKVKIFKKEDVRSTEQANNGNFMNEPTTIWKFIY